jgi:hypothetical protein
LAPDDAGFQPVAFEAAGTVGVGVETGPERHQLADTATRHGGCQGILGEALSRGNEQAQLSAWAGMRQDRVSARDVLDGLMKRGVGWRACRLPVQTHQPN